MRWDEEAEAVAKRLGDEGIRIIKAKPKRKNVRKGPDLRRELRSWMTACDTCGSSHTATLVWHHIGPKTAGAFTVARYGDRVALIRELANCRLLCHNCHAIAHWKPPKYQSS